jgi:transcriptional regulator with XRE-family HTH domain
MPLALDNVSIPMRRSDQPQPALGKAIRELRAKSRLTQEDLAHEADVTTGTLSLIERGQANPTWGTLRGIAKALDVSMGELGSLADKVER